MHICQKQWDLFKIIWIDLFNIFSSSKNVINALLKCCNITFMLYLVNDILIIIVCLDYHWRRLRKQTFSAISFAWLRYQRGLLDITRVSSYLHDSKAQNTLVTHNTARTATTENQYGSHSCLLDSALESSCISRGSRCQMPFTN